VVPSESLALLLPEETWPSVSSPARGWRGAGPLSTHSAKPSVRAERAGCPCSAHNPSHPASSPRLPRPQSQGSYPAIKTPVLGDPCTVTMGKSWMLMPGDAWQGLGAEFRGQGETHSRLGLLSWAVLLLAFNHIQPHPQTLPRPPGWSPGFSHCHPSEWGSCLVSFLFTS
jgi:hypothetical protein